MENKKEVQIQRLGLYLKSGQSIVIDFNVADPNSLNPQIEQFKNKFADPKAQDSIYVFTGQRLVSVRINEISAYEVVSLVAVPKEETQA